MVINFNCENCGIPGKRSYSKNRMPKHFFCSVKCQNIWQKTRQDIVIKNKDPLFREKVSEGLKRRKRMLGNNYHSDETKKKIGLKTKERWEKYTIEEKTYFINVLQNNALKKRTYKTYDIDWNKLSKKLRENQVCFRCGKKEKLSIHHIIPAKVGGKRELNNLVPLCNSCHRIVEHQTNRIFKIINDWEIISLLVNQKIRYTKYGN